MRNQEPSAGSASLLVLLQIPSGRDRRLERAVVLLRLVLELDLREVQRELVGRQVMRAVGAARLIRADDEVLHRNQVVVLLVFALLADEQLRLLDVLAGRAGEHQLGARLAHLGREVEVLEVNLAGAGATAVPGRTVVGVAPGEALKFNRIRMLAVLGFTFDAFDFQKIVGRHGCSSSILEWARLKLISRLRNSVAITTCKVHAATKISDRSEKIAPSCPTSLDCSPRSATAWASQL